MVVVSCDRSVLFMTSGLARTGLMDQLMTEACELLNWAAWILDVLNILKSIKGSFDLLFK